MSTEKKYFVVCANLKDGMQYAAENLANVADGGVYLITSAEDAVNYLTELINPTVLFTKESADLEDIHEIYAKVRSRMFPKLPKNTPDINKEQQDSTENEPCSYCKDTGSIEYSSEKGTTKKPCPYCSDLDIGEAVEDIENLDFPEIFTLKEKVQLIIDTAVKMYAVYAASNHHDISGETFVGNAAKMVNSAIKAVCGGDISPEIKYDVRVMQYDSCPFYRTGDHCVFDGGEGCMKNECNILRTLIKNDGRCSEVYHSILARNGYTKCSLCEKEITRKFTFLDAI
jgi:hypothetical protein